MNFSLTRNKFHVLIESNRNDTMATITWKQSFLGIFFQKLGKISILNNFDMAQQKWNKQYTNQFQKSMLWVVKFKTKALDALYALCMHL